MLAHAQSTNTLYTELYVKCNPPAYVAQRAKALGAAVLAGWLVRQGVGSSLAFAGMSSQAYACYEIILGQV